MREGNGGSGGARRGGLELEREPLPEIGARAPLVQLALTHAVRSLLIPSSPPLSRPRPPDPRRPLPPHQEGRHRSQAPRAQPSRQGLQVPPHSYRVPYPPSCPLLQVRSLPTPPSPTVLGRRARAVSSFPNDISLAQDQVAASSYLQVRGQHRLVSLSPALPQDTMLTNDGLFLFFLQDLDRISGNRRMGGFTGGGRYAARSCNMV